MIYPHEARQKSGVRIETSKLEKYLNVLEVLVDGPKKLDNIAYTANIECVAVKQSLVFLILNGLIEKRDLGSDKRVVYAITERGLAVFKTLKISKYLKKLKDTLPIVDEARDITSILNQRSKEWKEQ